MEKNPISELEAINYLEFSTKWPRIAERLYGRPLCIAKTKLDVIVSALHRHASLDAPELEAEIMRGRRDERGFVEFPGGVAVVPVMGTLVQRSGFLDALSGITSYQTIRRPFLEAVEADDVQHVVFEIDSPGGESAGLFDLVDDIYASRGEKTLTAIINEQGYSAAYAIASAADSIIVTRTAGAGSIGVIARHVDISQAEKDAGIKVTEIFAGEKKADLSPHKPLSDRALADLQAAVDDAYEIFVDTVARNRGMTTQAMRDTKAGFFIGQSAVKAGLADEVAAFDEAVSSIASQSNQRGFMMSEGKDAGKAAAQSGQSNVVDLKKIKAELRSELKAETKAELDDYKARIKEINSMCAAIGHPELAAEFIQADLSPVAARKQLFDRMASGEVAINNAHEAMPRGETMTEDAIQQSWDAAFAKVQPLGLSG